MRWRAEIGEETHAQFGGTKVQHYVYAVVNSAAPPETPPTYIANTRAECRAYLDQQPDAVGYRIKRGKLVLYGR